jgi:hypothetical protein
MFGMGRRKVIEDRAKALGQQLFWLLSMIRTMTFEEFIESAERQGFVESYRDLSAKQFEFFEGKEGTADVSYQVDYGNSIAGPRVTCETHGDYYGLNLSGAALNPGISVDLSTVIPRSELGRSARALQVALLRFPGFTSLNQIMARLRGP